MSKKMTDPNIQKIAEILKDEFNPTRLFLFGSRANGNPHKDSDYDFVVVVKKTNKNRAQNMTRASHLIHTSVGVSADVFVYDEKEFNDWKDELSSIPETALNTGKEIELG